MKKRIINYFIKAMVGISLLTSCSSKPYNHKLDCKMSDVSYEMKVIIKNDYCAKFHTSQNLEPTETYFVKYYGTYQNKYIGLVIGNEGVKEEDGIGSVSIGYWIDGYYFFEPGDYTTRFYYNYTFYNLTTLYKDGLITKEDLIDITSQVTDEHSDTN